MSIKWKRTRNEKRSTDIRLMATDYLLEETVKLGENKVI